MARCGSGNIFVSGQLAEIKLKCQIDATDGSSSQSAAALPSGREREHNPPRPLVRQTKGSDTKLDFTHAFEAFVNTFHGVNMASFRNGLVKTTTACFTPMGSSAPSFISSILPAIR